MRDTKNMRIILASASPRRKQILSDMGVKFTVFSADADERSDISDPVELTKHLARIKGEAVLEQLKRGGTDEGAIIISADTVVFCQSEILGKPRTREQAFKMLSSLSGKCHTVATGIAVTANGKCYTDCSVTRVFVDTIPEHEIYAYIDSGEPFDKAGGYGIQGQFSKWISGIEGCYFGVVGLPTHLLNKLFFKAVGVYPNQI